jgi:hypothetical protein
MPKVVGIRERRHQPFYDTLIRVGSEQVPTPTVSATTKLFASGQFLSNTAWTNMATAGQLASDQTLVILAMRCSLYFKGTKALDLYSLCQSQLFLNLYVGDKSMFLSPCWMFPAGGGIDCGSDATTPIANNGVPSQESILKFAKAIPVPARQHFNVEATFYSIGGTTPDALAYLNLATSIGARNISVFLDGLNTRDVQ